MKPSSSWPAFEAADPQWCLFWGESVKRLHLDIWLPYLRRSRYRFALLSGSDTIPADIREEIEGLPNCTIVEPYVEALHWLKRSRTLKGVLYVGTKERNFTVVNRLTRRSHVWIGHGESDKVYSALRTASLYDSVFVARYPLVERYPPSIRRWVRAGALAIGTPIVEGVAPDPWERPRPVRTVLYAPTWEGHTPNADYSSIPEVVPHLIDSMPALRERGVEIILRAHPVTGRRLPAYRALVDALVDAGAVVGCTKADSFQRADLMISDVSGVTSEFLFTEKPQIIPVSERLAGIGKDGDRLRRVYPYAYTWDPGTESLADRLAGLERADPLRGTRASSSRSMFKGHRSLEEATATFDTALATVRWKKAHVRLSLVFEARLRLRPLLAIRERRRDGRAADPEPAA